jgi:hypothetical protein
MLDTPVLFIVFNRPETTRQVFEAIRQARPRQLFVAADGPRADRDGEVERCAEVRRIATAVDWDCELRTMFRTENLGCGLGPKTGIDWFFENVDQGIILEDDCLPSPDFFQFSECLLEKYASDTRVMQIAGTNILGEWEAGGADYFFSDYAGIWGWATWRRAWKLYDYTLAKWEHSTIRALIQTKFFSPEQIAYQSKMYDKTRAFPEEVTWWDYQWHFARLINAGLGIIPARNLISNIGFGPNATHTFDSFSPQSNLNVYRLHFPLKINDCLIADRSYDQQLFPVVKTPRRIFRIWQRVKNRLITVKNSSCQ